jgi:hypothetical protein
MTINKQPPVSATHGPDGQWIFDPPFTGVSYPEFKAWHHHAQEAAEEHLRLNGETPSNIVALGVPDLMAVNWDVLSPDDAVAFATEAIDSYEAKEVFTVSWDFGTPMHNGIDIAYQISSRFFAQTESGLLGPFESLEDLFEETELNNPISAGLVYESTILKASEIAEQLRSEFLKPGDKILINNERWTADHAQRFVLASAAAQS